MFRRVTFPFASEYIVFYIVYPIHVSYSMCIFNVTCFKEPRASGYSPLGSFTFPPPLGPMGHLAACPGWLSSHERHHLWVEPFFPSSVPTAPLPGLESPLTAKLCILYSSESLVTKCEQLPKSEGHFIRGSRWSIPWVLLQPRTESLVPAPKNSFSLLAQH